MFKKSLLLLLIPLMSFTAAHKFYLSVTDIEHSEKNKSLQIITKVFIDDMEDALNERYDITANLSSKNESKAADLYLEKYLKKKIQLTINGEERSFVFLGKEFEEDLMLCYLEVEQVEKLESIEVVNSVLCDMFDEQQNILHIKANGKSKSYMLVKENDKALLNF